MRRTERIRRRNLLLAAKRAHGNLQNNEGILQVAQLLWKTLDTPLSLGLSLLANNGQIEDVLRVSFTPSRYLDYEANHAADDYQAISFLRKMPLVLPGVSRVDSATRAFWDAERECRKTNARFRSARDSGDYPRNVGAVLYYAQRKISRVLGHLDARSWALRCRFGPGVDHLAKGGRVSPYNKLARIGSTFDFSAGALALACSHPAWERYLNGSDVFRGEPRGAPGPSVSGDDHRGGPGSTAQSFEQLTEPPLGGSGSGGPHSEQLQVPDDGSSGSPERLAVLLGALSNVPGNRVTFVPKTALIDRAIAIEPRMNIFAQLGLGALIRSRLKRSGLNLDDQGPNQVLAQKGSVDGSVATIDLSSASDTIARELVRELIPEPWYDAMDWVRSKVGTIATDVGETSFRYEKFSSMGNGFTFELESLIFWALALGVCEHLQLTSEEKKLVRSYGDDITVPTRAVELLGEVLAFCGFQVNPSKSYSTGVFRESCGADFFNGKNVRPYFQKEFCSNVQGLYRLANGLRRVAYRRNLNFGCDGKLIPVWRNVVKRIPDSLRELTIPFRQVLPPPGGVWDDVESGDGGLAVNLDEALSSRWVSFNRDYQRGWSFAELRAGTVVDRASDENLLFLYALYASRDGTSGGEQITGSLITQRGISRLLLNTRAYSPSWFELGPWF